MTSQAHGTLGSGTRHPHRERTSLQEVLELVRQEMVSRETGEIRITWGTDDIKVAVTRYTHLRRTFG